MRRIIICLALAAIIFIGPGCAFFKLRKDYSKVQDVKTGENAIFTYFKDRLYDFIDIFGFKGAIGEGLLFNVRGTKLLQVGAGAIDGEKFGFKGRELGYWHEWRGEVGVSLFYINTARKTPLIANEFLFDEYKRTRHMSKEDIDIYRNDDRHWADIGVTLHLGFVGFDFDLFRIKEFFDFLVGIVTLDITKDDTRNRLRRKETEFIPVVGGVAPTPVP
ncbi:MAG: hypothetical protein ACYS8W_15925 [Planctomycetota bacterium]|jgi:hypothetical protein